MIRNQLNLSRINAVHLLKQKTCRTPVALCRASMSLQPRNKKDVDGREIQRERVLATSRSLSSGGASRRTDGSATSPASGRGKTTVALRLAISATEVRSLSR